MEFKIKEIKSVELKTYGHKAGDTEKRRKWEKVNRETFLQFLKEYPVKLESDYYMEVFTWNDFSDSKKWPESIVARHNEDDENYYIWRGEYEEITYTEDEKSKVIMKFDNLTPYSIENDSKAGNPIGGAGNCFNFIMDKIN